MNRIEKIHTLTKRLILMTAASVLVFAAIFGICLIFKMRFWMTGTAFLCGIIGGFVSIQQRIRKVSDEELTLLAKSWFQILLIPIFGGVFSLVLYCILLSGILTGNLFPEFCFPLPPDTGPDNNYMIALFTKTYPKTGQDFAKFLFWAFVAGFSERFVPQIISKVTTTITKSDNSDEQ